MSDSCLLQKALKHLCAAFTVAWKQPVATPASSSRPTKTTLLFLGSKSNKTNMEIAKQIGKATVHNAAVTESHHHGRRAPTPRPTRFWAATSSTPLR